ncbi:MAG: hypothetical protein WBW73_17960, partial [Rhodoplanes sp.]
VAKENKAFPIGAGNWLRLHPKDRVKTPYSSWTFDATTVRMPEFTAPGLGRESIRDRDRSYGEVFVRRVRAMGIRDGPISPRSPWPIFDSAIC